MAIRRPYTKLQLAGDDTVVRLLVERGVRLDIRDTVWRGTPLGWAEHEAQAHVANHSGQMPAASLPAYSQGFPSIQSR